MRYKSLITWAVVSFTAIPLFAEMRYSGGDISLLPEYEKVGSKYKDHEGNPIDLLPYLHEIGMNAMRVRLFVDPESFDGNDPNACQSLPYIIPLCKDIIDNGFDLMLDFHYSDTWADPGKQWIPKAWEGLSEEELVQKIYDYTKESLQTLKEEGITPAFIQPGNEISYGMLWSPYGQNPEANKTYITSSNKPWQRLCNLLNSAIKACREECPDAKIVLHTERVAKVNVQNNFYNQMEKYNVDYDIIGLSYYPYFHGKMSVLDNALTSLETNFPDKEIMIVETGFPYKWEVPGTDQSVDYSYSDAGQDKFAHELVETLLDHSHVNGLFWWWMEYNAYGSNPSLSGWYNAPLFDSLTGMATSALKTIAGYATSDYDGVDTILEEKQSVSDRWFDIMGRQIPKPSSPGYYIHNGNKILIK